MRAKLAFSPLSTCAAWKDRLFQNNRPKAVTALKPLEKIQGCSLRHMLTASPSKSNERGAGNKGANGIGGCYLRIPLARSLPSRVPRWSTRHPTSPRNRYYRKRWTCYERSGLPSALCGSSCFSAYGATKRVMNNFDW